MCGIAGVVRIDGAPVDDTAAQAMITALAHRGPDGSGLVVEGPAAFAHRRLSILDPTPAGAQPMRRGSDVLVHNGEVYNYLELAAELRERGHQLDTETDTEVILAAYQEWGVDAVERFNGMFAFALWDARRGRLLLARDRLGIKPLYLRRSARSIAFASEVKALVVGRPLDPADDWRPEPHGGAVHDLLARGKLDHSRLTFIDGVTALAPGHLLVVEDGAERSIRYWGPPTLADDERPTVRGTDLEGDRRLIEEFRAAFDASVRLRLRSDVPIGTCLSGGLDSSSIVSTVAELVQDGVREGGHEQVPRMAFHARFPGEGIDESRFAQLVAERSDVSLFFQSPTGSPLLASVLPVLRAQGEPYGGASINAQYAVMSAAHGQGLKVLLDGQGADELLGGYVHACGVRTAGLARAGRPRAALQELRSQVAIGVLPPAAALNWAIRGALPRSAIEAIRVAGGGRFGIRCTDALRHEPPLEQLHAEPGTLLARKLWQAMSADGLPSLLRYEDRNSMAFGIEARVPFLDVHLVELAVRLPDRLRIDHGDTKAVLRRAMRGRLPEEIRRRRDKLGFAAPQQAWLEGGQSEVAALVRDGQVVRRGWVAPAEVERVLETAFTGRRGTEQLWRLFITEAWLRLTWPDVEGVGGRSEWEAGLAADVAGGVASGVAAAGAAADGPLASASA